MVKRALFSLVTLGAVSADIPAVVPFGDSEIHICSDSIIRVTHRPSSAAVEKTSLIAKSDWEPVQYTTKKDGDIITVETSKLSVKLSSADQLVTFSDLQGKVVLQEKSTSFTKTQDLGQDTYQVEQSWEEASKAEGLFGGGSYQNGFVNFKNAPVEMIQFNTEAVVPFFTSTHGYGLLWDNYAWTYLNPPTNALVAPGAATPDDLVFTPVADGDHFFFVGKAFPATGDKPAFGNGMNKEVQLTLTDPDGQVITVQSWDKLTNLPNSITGRATGLQAGKAYKVAFSQNFGAGLYVQGPEYGKTTLRSFVGDMVDYYFVYGETMSNTLGGYRELTGAAPLYGKWVYGFWQCKEHYATQSGLLEAAHGFRNRSIPVDAFVQDWHYWGDMGWGPQWDPKVYPDPAAMVKELSDLNIHLMVSVWSKFDKSTTFWQQMNDKKWILGDSLYYDPFVPEARELYYNFSKDAHFSIGVDSLWQDATEPEDFPNIGQQCGGQSCSTNFNAYSLETTRAIAEGLRRDYPTKQGARVFTLTRSSFAAQQTTGATLWTGDISGTWDSLRRQIASSLNYGLSGMPYWAQDIGGFFRPKDQYESPDYHDLLIRWFQFGVFTPVFRVHGAGTNTELWNFGDEVMQMINSSAITLRYRLLPYTYSGFARVEQQGYTMQRHLSIDYTDDVHTRDIADQFMYGDAFLVAPFHTPGESGMANRARTSKRSIYLPAGNWVQFHTGDALPSGVHDVSFPLEQAPVFVRAGSLVPLGPQLQHSGERQADRVELRVYPGADASFQLFEDDGASTDYRHGEFATIDFVWNEAQKELTISKRKGSFSGMLQTRVFDIVFVQPGHGVGVQQTESPDATITYTGDAVVVPMKAMLV